MRSKEESGCCTEKDGQVFQESCRHDAKIPTPVSLQVDVLRCVARPLNRLSGQRHELAGNVYIARVSDSLRLRGHGRSAAGCGPGRVRCGARDGPPVVDQLSVSNGVTGSGKTFTMANVIERVQRPTLVIAHNKTLAAQLATEFKEFHIKLRCHSGITTSRISRRRTSPKQRCRVLRQLLRLLSARGVHPTDRPLHREGRRHQRGAGQAPPFGDAGAPSRTRRRRPDRGLGLLHFRLGVA